MSRREMTARRNASATVARPTKRSWAGKKAEREQEFLLGLRTRRRS